MKKDWNSGESTGQKPEEIITQQTHCFTLLRGLPHSLPHYITTLFSYPTTSTCLSHSHFIAFALVVSLPLLPNDLLEKRLSLVLGSSFHSKTLVFTLSAHRLKCLHVREQAHRSIASSRGTVPQGRLGKKLGSVS